MFFEFDGIENARELGGLTRPDGARIKDNLLFRTGHLGHATDEDIKRLAELGVSCVMDLRDPSEVRRAPDRDVPGAKHFHFPALPDLGTLFPPVNTATPAQARQAFHDMYRYLGLFPESIEAYSGFFRELLAAEGKPVLWHCTQGKDRTGVGTMLLLSALGFDRETVIQEYMLTNRFAQKQLEAMRLARASEEELALMGEVFPVFEQNARYWFECIDIEYGSVQTYLELALNVGPEQIARLEEYCLE